MCYFPQTIFFHLSVTREDLWLQSANTSLCGHDHSCGQASHDSSHFSTLPKNTEDIKGTRLGARENQLPVSSLPLVLAA